MKYARKSEECAGYVKSQETSLPVCIGVMLYAKIPKRELKLVDRLHVLACRLPRATVLRLSSDLAKAACERFKEKDTVCPPNLKTNVFTAEVVDNIDHNRYEFISRTCVALIQHPTEARYILRRVRVGISNHSNPCAS